MRARSGCHCPCEAAAAGTVRTCCRHRGSLAPARRLLVEPAFPGPPAMPSDTRPPDDASSASTRERVGSCAALSRSFLKVAVCMAPDLGSSTDLSAKPSQRRARSGTASVPPGRMVIPATAAKDIAWFSSVALAALWPLLPSTSGFAVFYKTLFYKAHIAHDSTLEHPSIRASAIRNVPSQPGALALTTAEAKRARFFKRKNPTYHTTCKIGPWPIPPSPSAVSVPSWVRWSKWRSGCTAECLHLNVRSLQCSSCTSKHVQSLKEWEARPSLPAFSLSSFFVCLRPTEQLRGMEN